MKYSKKLLKYSVTAAALLSVSVSSMGGITKAAEGDQSRPTTAKVTFRAPDNNKTNVTPPVDPTNPSQKPDDGKLPNPGDKGNTGTNANGPLSIDYAPSFDFGVGEVTAQSKTYTLNQAKDQNGNLLVPSDQQRPFVQVTDNRGTAAGWSLNAKIDNFQFSNGDAGKAAKTLQGATVSIAGLGENGGIQGAYGNTTTAPQGKTGDIQLSNDSQNLINAVSGTGTGAWIQKYDPSKVTLTVPGNQALIDTAYTANITWTLSTSPVQ